jgi:hypothetical protein
MTIDPQAPTPSAVNPLVSVDTLKGKFDPDVYLFPRSDVVAQLVFNHQMHMSNLLTGMGWRSEQPAGTKTPPSSARWRTMPESVPRRVSENHCAAFLASEFNPCQKP